MAMSDTEMALLLGQRQLDAMRPVNPGAFSGMGSGVTSDQETRVLMDSMRANQMQSLPMMQSSMQQPMDPAMMDPAMNFDPNDQNSMMMYVQSMADRIRQRLASGQTTDRDAGALKPIIDAMRAGQQVADQMNLNPMGSGVTSDQEVKTYMDSIK